MKIIQSKLSKLYYVVDDNDKELTGGFALRSFAEAALERLK